MENATNPRFGAAVRVPKLNWVFRAFYGHFYQAPPLLTASGPVVQFVNSQNLSFIPLRGERDEESQFGVTIPLRGWTVDADTFKTRAKNYFDHSNVGNSDIFFPVTMSLISVGLMFLLILNPLFGALDALLRSVDNVMV